MYTKLLRKIMKLRRWVAGHCTDGGDSGPTQGHCS